MGSKSSSTDPLPRAAATLALLAVLLLPALTPAAHAWDSSEVDRLYGEAKAALQAGDFEHAAASFEACLPLVEGDEVGTWRILVAAAFTYTQMDRPEVAVSYFDQFIARSDGHPAARSGKWRQRRDKAVEQAAALRKLMPEPAAEAPIPVETPVPFEAPPTPELPPGEPMELGATYTPSAPPSNVGPWLLVGTAGATVVAGVVFTSLSFAAHNQLKSLETGASYDADKQRYDTLLSRRDGTQTASFVLYGVAGVALAGGLSWLLVNELGGDDVPATAGLPRLEVSPLSGGVRATAGWSF